MDITDIEIAANTIEHVKWLFNEAGAHHVSDQYEDNEFLAMLTDLGVTVQFRQALPEWLLNLREESEPVRTKVTHLPNDKDTP